MADKSLVITQEIGYDRTMDSTGDDISRYERQNAVISYCFLGIFILLSRQERFQSHFINSHARVATLIQFLFLCLIAITIYSGHFTSMLVFDVSLSNIAYFISFGLLLASLATGIIGALLGKMPHIHIKSLSLRELGNHMVPKTVDSVEKIPMILSHIPLIGNYISSKYGNTFASGERFATWSIIASIFLIWISPSMILPIIFWSLMSLWIIYQSISLAIDNHILLLGDYLPRAEQVHIFLITLGIYTKGLLLHDHNALPNWTAIYLSIEKTYHRNTEQNIPERFPIPLVNIYSLLKNYKNTALQPEIIQGYSITIIFLVSILRQEYTLTFLTLFIGYVGFLSLRFGRYLDIPLLGEIAVFLQKIFVWAEKKSQKQTSQFPS
ncbi:MAG: hypothetical protein WC753_04325 [Candidatus Gracilibacteria bacterium]